MRLVTYLAQSQLLQSGDEVLVLNDHGKAAGEDEGATFCSQLETYLCDLCGAEVPVRCFPIALEDPTNLNDLYEKVFKAIPSGPSARETETLFHLSPGTPAMQVTLVLAASCLPLEKVRLFVSHQRHGVREIELPYVIALKAAQRYSRAPTVQAGSLHDLLPNMVADDPSVRTLLAALQSSCEQPLPVLLAGPAGSGKRQTALQIAHWRKRGVVVFDCAAGVDLAAQNYGNIGTLVVTHLESAREPTLQFLIQWLTQPDRSGAKWVGTWRTDLNSKESGNVLLQRVLELFRSGGTFLLPSLSRRTDVVDLAESMAREEGMLDSKVKERFQHALMTSRFPSGLHDLRSLVTTASSFSASRHIDYAGFAVAQSEGDGLLAARVMARACAALLAGRRNSGMSAPELLDVIEYAAIECSRAGGASQEAAAKSLGYASQSALAYRLKATSNAYEKFLAALYPDAQ